MMTQDDLTRLAQVDPRLVLALLLNQGGNIRLDVERAVFRLSYRAGVELPNAPLTPLPHHNDEEAP